MNLLDKKQLNLLVHLARVDGKFENSERELLLSFVKMKGLDKKALRNNEPIDLSDFTQTPNKVELLHWALKVMHADKVIHPKEIVFCRKLAIKLGFREEIIEHFRFQALPEYDNFAKEAKQFWAIGG